MNINMRKKEVIEEIDKSIIMYREYQNKACKEISNSLANLGKIIFSGELEKSDLKYLSIYIKSLIAKLNIAYLNLFKTNSWTLKAIVRENSISEKLNEIRTQNEIIMNDYDYHIKEEKAYISYWLKRLYDSREEFFALGDKIKYLQKQKKELIKDELREVTFYDIATLEEKDVYDKAKYCKQDLHKETVGLNSYLKEQGYIVDPKEQKAFIHYLRNYLFNLISVTPDVNDQKIFALYDKAYNATVKKFGAELIKVPSINRMLNYLVLSDKIRYNSQDGSIINCTQIKAKYNKELDKLFTRAFLEFVTYIDIDKIEEIYDKCKEVVSDNTNFYPERPLSLNKVMENALGVRRKRMK